MARILEIEEIAPAFKSYIIHNPVIARRHRAGNGGIVQARRLHHNRITVVFVGQASRLPGGRLDI